MKKRFISQNTVGILLATFLVAITTFPVCAGNIVWDGDTGRLKPDPIPGHEGLIALFPQDDISNNTVTVDGPPPVQVVYGGVTADPGKSVTGNTVLIFGAAEIESIGGGMAIGSVSDNQVKISGGDIGEVSGGLSVSDNSTNNKVFVDGGNIAEFLVSGIAFDGDANDNNVSFSAGTVGGSIAGGFVHNNGNARRNSVVFSGGRVEGAALPSPLDFLGKIAIAGGIAMRSGVSENNSVTISGGTINSNILGGLSIWVDAGDGASTGNSVAISGSPEFDDEVLIYGGVSLLQGADTFTGNTLSVQNYTGTAVGGISDFQNFNFTLPQTLQNGGVVLNVKGTVYLQDREGKKSSRVSDIQLGNNVNIEIGDTIVLIQADILEADVFEQAGQKVAYTDDNGKTVEWTLELDTISSPNTLKATLNKKGDLLPSSNSSGCNAGFGAGMLILILAFATTRRRIG
ncbi:MAG: SYNERG-CTERM sorting domain-containing protein [Holosporales bacterium]|nr:SYNERG-CTERM sorting domain-containing protein [Holosporales bacterium]